MGLAKEARIRKTSGASGFWCWRVSAQAVAGDGSAFHSHHRRGQTLGPPFLAALLRTTGLGRWNRLGRGSCNQRRLHETGLRHSHLTGDRGAGHRGRTPTSVKAAGGSTISVMMSSATGALRAYSPQPALATARKQPQPQPQRKLFGDAGQQRGIVDSIHCGSACRLEDLGMPLFRGARPTLNDDLTGWTTPTPPSSPYRAGSMKTVSAVSTATVSGPGSASTCLESQSGRAETAACAPPAMPGYPPRSWAQRSHPRWASATQGVGAGSTQISPRSARKSNPVNTFRCRHHFHGLQRRQC